MTATRTALTIAGSDSGGGAGIQADLKTFAMFGVFGMSAVTAITAQNTRGVFRVDPIPPDGVRAQLQAVFDDIRVDVVKIGMLATAEHARVVARFLHDLREARPPVVLDPVMVASTGHHLLTDDAVAVIREELLPLCTIATPNLAEARVLTGGEGDAWLARQPASILVTGGDVPAGELVRDRWWDAGRIRREWVGPRLGTLSFHGTGCTLASAIASGLALGRPPEEAIDQGIGYVRRLIAESIGGGTVGGGNPTLPHHRARPAGDGG